MEYGVCEGTYRPVLWRINCVRGRGQGRRLRLVREALLQGSGDEPGRLGDLVVEGIAAATLGEVD